MPKMKFAAAKKELDACCKELSRSGLSFDKDWKETGEVLVQKQGSGRGVDDVLLMGQVDPENDQGFILEIAIAWNLRFFLQPVLKARPSKYDPESGLERKEFVEKVFGLKFGENVFDTIKRGPLDVKDSDSFVSRILSAPVCGIDEVMLFQNGSNGKLIQISLLRSQYAPPRVKDVADAKARCGKELASIADWLGLATADFKTTEKTEDKGAKETVLKSEYFKDGFQIEVCCGWSEMKDSGEMLFTPPGICFRFFPVQSSD